MYCEAMSYCTFSNRPMSRSVIRFLVLQKTFVLGLEGADRFFKDSD